MDIEKKLVVEFWQIENVVNMRVLSQPEIISRGCGTVCLLPKMHIKSDNYPRMEMNEGTRTLFIRGKTSQYDKRIACYSFKDNSEASSFIDHAIDAITTVNYLLENNKKFCVSAVENGAVNTIAGLNRDEWEEFINGKIQ